MSSPAETTESYLFPKPYADFVARLRVPSGFLLLAVFALRSNPSRLSLLAGLPVSAIGLVIRGWAAGHLAKNQRLATAGPYAYVRNPLYLGTLIVALGIVIACHDFVLAAIFAATFVFVYLPVVELEEQHLRDLFPEYEAYAAQVHRFLPTRERKPARGAFSWKRYMRNQEYKALAGFAAAVAWLVWRACF